MPLNETGFCDSCDQKNTTEENTTDLRPLSKEELEADAKEVIERQKIIKDMIARSPWTVYPDKN